MYAHANGKNDTVIILYVRNLLTSYRRAALLDAWHNAFIITLFSTAILTTVIQVRDWEVESVIGIFSYKVKLLCDAIIMKKAILFSITFCVYIACKPE